MFERSSVRGIFDSQVTQSCERRLGKTPNKQNNNQKPTHIVSGQLDSPPILSRVDISCVRPFFYVRPPVSGSPPLGRVSCICDFAKEHSTRSKPSTKASAYTKSKVSQGPARRSDPPRLASEPTPSHTRALRERVAVKVIERSAGILWERRRGQPLLGRHPCKACKG